MTVYPKIFMCHVINFFAVMDQYGDHSGSVYVELDD